MKKKEYLMKELERLRKHQGGSIIFILIVLWSGRVLMLRLCSR